MEIIFVVLTAVANLLRNCKLKKTEVKPSSHILCITLYSVSYMSTSILYSSQPPVPKNISRLLTLQYCFLGCTASIQIDRGQISLIYCISLIYYILLCKTERFLSFRPQREKHVASVDPKRRAEESSMKINALPQNTKSASTCNTKTSQTRGGIFIFNSP